MIFCQFADCVSLREISNGLHSANGNLNHLGISRAPSKSSLAYQNEHRCCSFFRDCYYALLDYFGQQIRFSGRKFRYMNAVYALDSTIITLSVPRCTTGHATHTPGESGESAHTVHAEHQHAASRIRAHITDGKAGDNTAARNVER